MKHVFTNISTLASILVARSGYIHLEANFVVHLFNSITNSSSKVEISEYGQVNMYPFYFKKLIYVSFSLGDIFTDEHGPKLVICRD